MKNKQEILAVAKAINADLVGGALGEMKGCAAYVEEVKMSEQGYLTKYFGVSYYFHGKTDNDVIDRVTITKRAFREIIRLFPVKFFKITSSFALIYRAEGGLKSKCLRQEEFCPSCRELIRVGLEYAENTLRGKWFTPKELEAKKQFDDLVFCFAMFLQCSLSYRMRVQDIFGIMDKENFRKAPIKELWRVRKEVLWRENVVKEMMSVIFWVALLGLIFKRKLICGFISELDFDKVRMDEADWYFSLRRGSYDYKGLSLYQRIVEAEKIDKEEGNIILEV